ncbi:MAG: class I SAM-dependent RNA methyltransferase, partial [Lachnospiraceae bacterium]|nr:class I SAM-dependent RNA methyltransferase [Lachnospiraceae bacterium]
MEKQKRENACPYAKKCGGCIYSGKAYEEQLKLKQKNVSDLLGKFAKVAPILGTECPEHYRNKVHGIFGRDRQGNVFTGIYEEKSHRIVPVEDCLIEDEKATAILKTLSKMAKQFKLQIYDEDRETGLLRHALIRVGRTTGEIMVVLVVNAKKIKRQELLVSKLTDIDFGKDSGNRPSQIVSIQLNVNTEKTNVILGKECITIYGRDYIEDCIGDVRFRISALSFYQVNPVQTCVL